MLLPHCLTCHSQTFIISRVEITMAAESSNGVSCYQAVRPLAMCFSLPARSSTSLCTTTTHHSTFTSSSCITTQPTSESTSTHYHPRRKIPLTLHHEHGRTRNARQPQIRRLTLTVLTPQNRAVHARHRVQATHISLAAYTCPCRCNWCGSRRSDRSRHEPLPVPPLLQFPLLLSALPPKD